VYEYFDSTSLSLSLIKLNLIDQKLEFQTILIKNFDFLIFKDFLLLSEIIIVL